MSNIILKPKFNFEVQEIAKADLKEILKTLSHVEQYYPNFKNWLYSNFSQKNYLNDRKIVIAHSDGALSGLALLKDAYYEKKICSFYVSPNYREKGLGVSLMEKSLEELGRYDISITVAEERNLELKQLLTNSSFCLDKEEVGIYRTGKTEFFYSR